MQFIDLTGAIKDAVIIHLASYPRLNQFVPPSRVFAMQTPANPTYPYVRFGTPITQPYEETCGIGTSCRLTLDAFAEGGPEAEAGESAAMLITSMIVEAMNSLVIPGCRIVANEYLGARQLMVDNEADRWRSIIEYNVTAVMPRL